MYEGEDGNTIDLLYEQATDECNGVKIIVPVLQRDVREFYSKIKQQLAYFESVYFNVSYNGSYNINNDFSIIRSEDFQISELEEDRYMHICLDNVYYPMDFSKLGILMLEVPIGLRFGLSDGIFPTPNRETIKYTQEAREIIMQKIKKVANYLIGEYNKTITECDTFSKIIKYYGNSYRYVTINGKDYECSELEKYSDVKIKSPTLIGVSLLDLETLARNKSDLLDEYIITHEVSNERIGTVKYGYMQTLNYSKLDNDIYICSGGEKFTFIKKAYLRELYPSYRKCYIIKKHNVYSLFPRYDENEKLLDDGFNYFKLLNLAHYPKEEWRQRIQEFQYIQKEYTSKFIDLDTLEVPQEWIEDRKTKKKQQDKFSTLSKRTKLKGEIIGKQARESMHYSSGKSCTFDSTKYKLEKIPTMRHLMVYTVHENCDKLDGIFRIANSQNIKLITFSNRELKIVNNAKIHNLISYEEFMEGNNKPFKRIVTARLIYDLIQIYPYVFHERDRINEVSTTLYDKLDTLYEYQKTNRSRDFCASTKIYAAMFEVAKDKHLFDEDIYPLYLEVEKILKKLKFLNPLLSKMPSYKCDDRDKFMDILKDLFKFYKFRMNYEVYNIKLNEEEEHVEEEALTDEAVENLIETNTI